VPWLLIDRPRRLVCVAGRRVEVRRKEYDLLLCLVDNANDFVSRRHILDEVWGDDQGISANSLHVHLSRLRSKLGERHDQPVFIHTSRGDGVMFASHRGHTFEPYTELHVPRAVLPWVRSAA
jgi:DNA-binding response OmpR family regulator